MVTMINLHREAYDLTKEWIDSLVEKLTQELSSYADVSNALSVIYGTHSITLTLVQAILKQEVKGMGRAPSTKLLLNMDVGIDPEPDKDNTRVWGKVWIEGSTERHLTDGESIIEILGNPKEFNTTFNELPPYLDINEIINIVMPTVKLTIDIILSGRRT